MITILIFFIILGVLVLVHEFGHYITAIRNGIKASEFGFGFPPRIGGFYKDENNKWNFFWGNREYSGENTLFSLNLIPLGGFVRIKGEDGQNKDEDSFATKSIFTRFKVLVAGVTMNLVLAWVLMAIVLMMGAPESLSDSSGNFEIKPFGINIFTRENHNEFDFSNVESGYVTKKSGGKSILFNKITFDSGEKIEKIEVKKAGMIMIDMVAKDSVAEKAGIKMGDLVSEICLKNDDCQKIKKSEDLKNFINQNSGQEVFLKVKRNNLEEKISIIPENKDGLGVIGISFAEISVVKYPWYKAIYEAFFRVIIMTVTLFGAFFTLIKSLFTDSSMAAGVSGPVGIVLLVKQMQELGLVYLFLFTASLSVNLAVINILPIPALDGGRILFLIIEKIKGKPVDEKIEGILHSAFFILLMILVVVITFNDITKFFK